MPQLVDPSAEEITALTDHLVNLIVRTIGNRQAAWQAERGASDLTECPRANVIGQRLWLMSFLGQALDLKRREMMGANIETKGPQCP